MFGYFLVGETAIVILIILAIPILILSPYLYETRKQARLRAIYKMYKILPANLATRKALPAPRIRF